MKTAEKKRKVSNIDDRIDGIPTQSKRPYLYKHAEFVCKACSPKLKARLRRNLVNNAKPSQIYAICECVKNVVTRECPVSPRIIEKLYRFSRPLMKLSLPKRNVTIDERRKILNQKGAGIFLPLILSSVASYLVDRMNR